MPTENKDLKKNNPTVTGFVEDERFALKDETGNRIPGTAFRGYQLNADGFTALQRHAVIGSVLLFRKSKSRNKKGNDQYFLEILPPMVSNRSKQDDI